MQLQFWPPSPPKDWKRLVDFIKHDGLSEIMDYSSSVLLIGGLQGFIDNVKSWVASKGYDTGRCVFF